MLNETRSDAEVALSAFRRTGYQSVTARLADGSDRGLAAFRDSVSRDPRFSITVLRFVVIKYGVMPASRGGKLKTVLQTSAIFLYLMPLDSWLGGVAGTIYGAATVGVMAAAVVVTVVTGVDYVVKAWRLRAAGR